ncbi:hypothetical protein [Kribbella sp. NPDC055071]
MRRGIIVVDRFVGTVVALALITAGGLALGWWYDVLPDAPGRVTLTGPADPAEAEWWPWATGAGGVLLLALGLWWLTKHLPRRVGGRFKLAGADRSGQLTADANSAASAAAAALTNCPAVRDASGRVVADRGELVAELRCTIEPSADLGTVYAAATRVAADLHHVIGLPDLRHRIHLRVARTDKTAPPRRTI